MYLKHRYGLGYETLVKEVSESFSWQQLCRLALTGTVPHSTTLLKLTRRFGPEVVEELNGALLRAAVERRVLRSRRLRVDTTVMEADVRYPTDSGLRAHAVSRLTRAVRRVQEAGLATGTRCRDRTRSVGKVVRRISHAWAGSEAARRWTASRARSTSWRWPRPERRPASLARRNGPSGLASKSVAPRSISSLGTWREPSM